MLLGVGLATPLTKEAVQPTQVQAATKYKIYLKKNSYVYNKKGKKTGFELFADQVYSAYGTKKIKGKKYFKLVGGGYIRYANAVVNGSNTKTSKSQNAKADSFKSKVMKATGITEAEFNKYTDKGYYHKGDIIGAIKNPWNYVNYENGLLLWKEGDDGDELEVATNVIEAKGLTASVSDSKAEKNEWAQQAAKSFIEKVNSLRIKRGLAPLQTSNSKLQNIADKRLSEIIDKVLETGTTSVNLHNRNGSNKFYTVYPEFGLSEYHSGEVLGYATGNHLSMSPENFAQLRYYGMIFNDAHANWRHRDALLSKSYPYTQIAVSVGFALVKGHQQIILVADLYW
ncbi:hypothetical protein FC52_GL001769 [Lactobacillus pasteurii DSM 23907 = CRBIP 24.76]|nr:hypothetical protein FC52_GL001769 [Lactobacillus pasteurii DSM 23907 = CRBIP 24.76]